MNVSTHTSSHHFCSLALFAVCLLGTTMAGAAQRVCQYEPTSAAGQIIWQHCVLPTVDAAVAKVNNPLLNALHPRRSSPAVAALNK